MAAGAGESTSDTMLSCEVLDEESGILRTSAAVKAVHGGLSVLTPRGVRTRGKVAFVTVDRARQEFTWVWFVAPETLRWFSERARMMALEAGDIVVLNDPALRSPDVGCIPVEFAFEWLEELGATHVTPSPANLMDSALKKNGLKRFPSLHAVSQRFIEWLAPTPALADWIRAGRMAAAECDPDD